MANEDPGHLAWVRRKPCAVCGIYGVQAHHAGPRGLGQRVHDHLAVPLCDPCHDSYHDGGGFFATKTKEQRRVWMMFEAGRHLMMHAEELDRDLAGQGIPF